MLVGSLENSAAIEWHKGLCRSSVTEGPVTRCPGVLPCNGM